MKSLSCGYSHFQHPVHRLQMLLPLIVTCAISECCSFCEQGMLCIRTAAAAWAKESLQHSWDRHSYESCLDTKMTWYRKDPCSRVGSTSWSRKAANRLSFFFLIIIDRTEAGPLKSQSPESEQWKANYPHREQKFSQLPLFPSLSAQS